MHTIISKRPGPFSYQRWKTGPGNSFVPDGRAVLVNGGSGLVGGAELFSGKPLEKRSTLIPVGVYTFVDDAMLEYLESIPKFKSDVKRGLVMVVKNQKVSDQNKVDEMAEKHLISDEEDPSRPITEENIEDAGAVINRDGSVNITDAEEDVIEVRNRNAGQPGYVKKREAEKRRGRKRKA